MKNKIVALRKKKTDKIIPNDVLNVGRCVRSLMDVYLLYELPYTSHPWARAALFKTLLLPPLDGTSLCSWHMTFGNSVEL